MVIISQKNFMAGLKDTLSCGKKSICIDLKQTEGIKITKKLALQADIILEPYRPGN